MDKKQTHFVVRTTTNLFDEIRALSQEDDRSINGEILFILKEYVANRKRQQKRIEQEIRHD